MQIGVKHLEWRVLRALVRARGRAVKGGKLRLEMIRRTADGTFLLDMADEGLIEGEGNREEPFEMNFKLTKLGAHVAEYGVYDAQLVKDESGVPSWKARPLVAM